MGSRCPIICFPSSTPPRAVGSGTQGLAAPGLHFLACHTEITGRIGQAAGPHPCPPRTVLQGVQRAHCSQPFPTLLRIYYCKSFQPAVFFALPSLAKSDKLVHIVSTLNSKASEWGPYSTRQQPAAGRIQGVGGPGHYFMGNPQVLEEWQVSQNSHLLKNGIFG